MSVPTDAELFRCGARTLLASWEEYARGAAGAVVRRLPGVTVAVFPNGPERAVYNNALLEPFLADSERAVALVAMEAAYAEAGVTRFAAWVHESDLATRADLERRGYTVDESTRAMGMSLDAIRLPRPEIELGTPDWSEYLRLLGVSPGLLAGADHDAFHVLVARLAGENVATAMAFDHAGDCGIYNVTSLARVRRRGLGTALTALHLHDARARGCRTASLQSTQIAEGVYTTTGFRDLGRIFEYVPRDLPVRREGRPGQRLRIDAAGSRGRGPRTAEHTGRHDGSRTGCNGRPLSRDDVLVASRGASVGRNRRSDRQRARRRVLRPAVVVPLLAAGAVVVGVLAYLFQPWRLWVDDVVNQGIPGAAGSAPAAASEQGAPGGSGLRLRVLASGRFESHEHETSGTVRVLRLPNGTRVLRLEDLDTSNGPALRVWVTDAPVVPGRAGWFLFDDGRHVDLGSLKGNIGNQNYPLPPGVDIAVLHSVSIWCERFHVSFGAAELGLVHTARPTAEDEKRRGSTDELGPAQQIPAQRPSGAPEHLGVEP